MKIEFQRQTAAGLARSPLRCRVTGETDRLTDVMLCAPHHLAPVPCCSVTRQSLRDGFTTTTLAALRQHRVLTEALAAHGVTVHNVAPQPGLADLCFTRDVAVTTPWGLVALNPALPHRRPEVDQLLAAAARLGVAPVQRIREGIIEGGDICIARPGLLIIGISGERTDETGANALAGRFEAEGWEVLRCRFDPHFLHLDTMFCMIDARTALACTDVLDDEFIEALEARGIRLIPVNYKQARRLGANILSIDGRTILVAAGHDSIERKLIEAGYEPVPHDISQFAACGGGIHCLTMPLARAGS